MINETYCIFSSTEMTKKREKLCTRSIETVDDFSALRIDWDTLLENSAEVNPFLSHQWLYTWWEVYGHGELYIVTCRDSASGELVGILPLFRFRTGGVLSATVVRFMGSEQVSSDFLECLARKGRELEVYAACFEMLQRDKHLWDIIELQDMDAESSFFHFLTGSEIYGLEVLRNSDKCCPYLRLPDSWEVLLKGLSTKVRQRVGYYRRALERKGVVVLEQVTAPGALPDALNELMRLRRDRLEQKGLSAGRVSEAYQCFHGRIMGRFLECGRLRLYFLQFDGERIAFLYLYAGIDRLFFYQTGFDRFWSNQSVGFVLLGMVIEQAIKEGYSKFEFLRGVERYKYEWNVSGSRQLVDVLISSRSLQARIYKLRRDCITVIVRSVKNIVPEYLQVSLKGVLHRWKYKN